MSNLKKLVKATTKRSIYESHGIEYRNGKIYHPVFGWINPLLINGNAKLGKGVWTFSVLGAYSRTPRYAFIKNLEYDGTDYEAVIDLLERRFWLVDVD